MTTGNHTGIGAVGEDREHRDVLLRHRLGGLVDRLVGGRGVDVLGHQVRDGDGKGLLDVALPRTEALDVDNPVEEGSDERLMLVGLDLLIEQILIGHDTDDLAALDKAVDLLLSTAESLHAADTSIGFLQPNSCRFGEWRDGNPFVTLPDVGFAWDKKAGLMMPNWISEPALGLLFENGAERRNEEYLAEISRDNDDRDLRKRASDAATRELVDVKILARLVATTLVGVDEIRRWCGDRKCLLKLPPRDVATDTQAEVWDKVIAPALAGQVTTVKELRSALATYKPSSHFLHKPPAAPWAGWAMLRQAVMVTAAAAMIGLLWAFSGSILEWFQGRPAPFCRNVTEESPLHRRLFDLEKSREAARGDVAARPAYWTLLSECRSDHAALKTCRSDCLGDLVEEWFRQAEEEGQAVRERLRARPRPTPEEVQDISAAIVAIRQATAEGKRQQRSGVVSMLERELRLRGGKLPVESTGSKGATNE